MQRLPQAQRDRLARGEELALPRKPERDRMRMQIQEQAAEVVAQMVPLVAEREEHQADLST